MLTTAFRFLISFFLVTTSAIATAYSSYTSGALSGLQLRCCVLDEPPIVFIDNRTYANSGISGIIAQYLRELQGYLNWSCSSVEYYKNPNFNHLITSMEHCSENGGVKKHPNCTCDIGISGWFENHHRYGRVDFLPPFVIDGYEVVFHIKNSEVSGQRMFFITTFDRLAWISIFGLMLLFSLVKVFDPVFCSNHQYQALPDKVSRMRRFVHFLLKYPTLYRFRRAVQSTYSDVVQNQGAPRIHRQWVLNTVTSVCGLFLILSYEASMTASIVQESISPGFQSIQDFQTCRIYPEEVCLTGGGALESFWNNSIAISKQKPIITNSDNDLLHALDVGTCAYGIVLKSTANMAINSKYCGTLLAAEQTLYSGGLTMVLPKNSNHTNVMSYATLKITNEVPTSGIEQYFASVPRCSIKNGTTLSFRKLQLFFSIAFCTAAFLLLLISINKAWRRIVEVG